MHGCGEREKRPICPDFNRSIKMDFQGAIQSSDTGFLLLRGIDERFGVTKSYQRLLRITGPLSHQELHRPDDSAAGLSDSCRV